MDPNQLHYIEGDKVTTNEDCSKAKTGKIYTIGYGINNELWIKNKKGKNLCNHQYYWKLVNNPKTNLRAVKIAFEQRKENDIRNALKTLHKQTK